METNCGIFNIDNKDWIDIKPFRYFKGPSNNAFNCKLCCNYDNDKIYLFDYSDVNYTSLYDINKHEWYTISTDKTLNFMYSFWYNDNVLYGLTLSTVEETKDSKFQLNKLDLREKEKKWIKSGIDFDGMSKDAFYSFFK